MWHRIAPATAVGLILLTASAHSTTRTLTERASRTFRLSPEAPVAIRATVGDVTVIGWDRPETIVDVSVSAPSAAGLSRISTTFDQSGSALVVAVTQVAEGKDEALRGSITVHAPSAQRFDAIDLFEGRLTLTGLRGGVRATVTRGRIEATAVSGRLRLETTIGAIHLAHAARELADLVRLRTFNGNIDVTFQGPPRDARILALSLGGSIRSDIPLTMRTGFGPRFGEATRGRGAPVVSLDTVNGDIRVKSK